MTITVVSEKSTFAHLDLIVTTARRSLALRIVTDPGATCRGTAVDTNSLVTGHGAAGADVTFGDEVAAQCAMN